MILYIKEAVKCDWGNKPVPRLQRSYGEFDFRSEQTLSQSFRHAGQLYPAKDVNEKSSMLDEPACRGNRLFTILNQSQSILLG